MAFAVGIGAGSSPTAADGQGVAGPKWVTAWATSPQGPAIVDVRNATVRMIARVTVGGEAVQVRLDNTFGLEPLVIGAAYVGPVRHGAALVPGGNRELTFGGSPEVRVPAGGGVTSDPVEMRVLAQQDLAVSLFLPGTVVRASQHHQAFVTSYIGESGTGNLTADESGVVFGGTTSAMMWLKAIDVLSAPATGAIVGFSDSITDGGCSTLDGHDRWLDWLAKRLYLASPDRHPAVVNDGLGGSTLTAVGWVPPLPGDPGLERFERDVTAHVGVTDVILFMGSNDIRRGATTDQVIAGLKQLRDRVKERGWRVIAATIIPRHNQPAVAENTGWNREKSQIRREVNSWIRESGGFDAVLDFDAVLRDPADPDRMRPELNCDGIHPNPRGYLEMGAAVPLDLFLR